VLQSRWFSAASHSEEKPLLNAKAHPPVTPAPAAMPASQVPVQTVPMQRRGMNPAWLRLSFASGTGASGSAGLNEGQRRYFEPLRSRTLQRDPADEDLRAGGEAIAAVLHKATDGQWGTDEDVVFNALSGHSVAELAIIKAAFQKQSEDGRSLESVLDDELSGDDLSRARSLLAGGTSASEAARRLWDAMRGPGTDEDAIYAALSGRTPAQWVEIQQAFRSLTNQEKDLVTELRDELNDSEWAKLQSLLPAKPATPGTQATPGTPAAADAPSGKQPEKDQPAGSLEDRAKTVADRIHAAIDPIGTDEEALYAALTGRSAEEIAAVAKLFGGMPAFEARLHDELSDSEYAVVRPLLYPGNADEALRPLVERLHEEINSLIASKSTVLSIIEGRSGEDQQHIRQLYFSRYDVSLDQELQRVFGVDAVQPHKLSLLENEDFRKLWEKQLLVGLELLRQKFDQKDPALRGCRFPSSGDQRLPFDTENWQISVQSSSPNTGAGSSSAEIQARLDSYTGAFEPKGTPFEAVTALFEHLERWECDCARYVEIAWLYAWHKTLGVEEFNTRFRGLRLRTQDTTGLTRDSFQNNADEVGIDKPTKNFDDKWRDAPVGTKVVWRNESSLAISPWREENAVKVEKSADGKTDLYDAHPLGQRMLEEEVKLGLAQNCAGFPDLVFEITLPWLRDLRDNKGLSNDFLAALKELKGTTVYGTKLLWSQLAKASPEVGQRILAAQRARTADPAFKEKDLELITSAGREGTKEEADQYVRENIRRLELSLPR